MSTTQMLVLPARFTLPVLSEWQTTVDTALQAGHDIRFDGSAVTNVDSAALQFITVVQHSIDSRHPLNNDGTQTTQEPVRDEHRHCLRLLQWPSPALSAAVLDFGLQISADGETSTAD